MKMFWQITTVINKADNVHTHAHSVYTHGMSRVPTHAIHCVYDSIQASARYIRVIQHCTFIGVSDSLHAYVHTRTRRLHVFLHHKCCEKHHFNAKIWIYHHGVRWQPTTYMQAISWNFCFRYVLTVAINRLEMGGRASILAEGSQWCPESSSLAVFCLALTASSLTEDIGWIWEVNFFSLWIPYGFESFTVTTSSQ